MNASGLSAFENMQLPSGPAFDGTDSTSAPYLKYRRQ